MTTALDSTNLLDILRPRSPYSARAKRNIEAAQRAGPAIICEPVYAEIASVLDTKAELDEYLHDMGVRMVPSSSAVLYHAGVAWREYTRRRHDGLMCSSCGSVSKPSCPNCKTPLRGRQHILADFIVGAHASANGGRLVTRDRGYYRTYFPGLVLIT